MLLADPYMQYNLLFTDTKSQFHLHHLPYDDSDLIGGNET